MLIKRGGDRQGQGVGWGSCEGGGGRGPKTRSIVTGGGVPPRYYSKIIFFHCLFNVSLGSTNRKVRFLLLL